VLRYLLNPLVGKNLRVVIGVCDGLRVVGPARCERRIAMLLEQCTPVGTTGCEEIEAVAERESRPQG
jgi:hypothetical protein